MFRNVAQCFAIAGQVDRVDLVVVPNSSTEHSALDAVGTLNPVHRSARARAIDGFADDVGVACVTGCFLDQMYSDPAQILIDHARPETLRIQIEGAKDVVRGDDL